MYFIVTSEIWQMAEDEADKLWKSGHKVVIFDAAVLIKAGWQKNMHQVGLVIYSSLISKKKFNAMYCYNLNQNP